MVEKIRMFLFFFSSESIFTFQRVKSYSHRSAICVKRNGKFLLLGKNFIIKNNKYFKIEYYGKNLKYTEDFK